jgi:AraC-like DNA-binding protein
MDLAARRLRETDDSLQTIAASVGYASVYAFSRAFGRSRSLLPGGYRARARDQARRGNADAH